MGPIAQYEGMVWIEPGDAHLFFPTGGGPRSATADDFSVRASVRAARTEPRAIGMIL